MLVNFGRIFRSYMVKKDRKLYFKEEEKWMDMNFNNYINIKYFLIAECDMFEKLSF